MRPCRCTLAHFRACQEYPSRASSAASRAATSLVGLARLPFCVLRTLHRSSIRPPLLSQRRKLSIPCLRSPRSACFWYWDLPAIRICTEHPTAIRSHEPHGQTLATELTRPPAETTMATTE